MGIKTFVTSLIVLAISIFLAFSFKNAFYKSYPIPKMEEPWWGPGKRPAKESTAIEKFQINIKDEVLEDLKLRLSNHRPFVPPLENIQQQYGMNTLLLKNIADYWLKKYNWRKQEKFLNKYPQYKTNIQGLNIHYLHIKPNVSSNIKTYPMLILHGWPGSVREFYEIIPYLTTPQNNRNYVFELVIPSLPGYGFSDPAVRPGLGAAQIAVVFKNLMDRLGFKKYFVQGGDWGSVITNLMAAFYPDKIIGTHSNMCIVMSPLSYLKTAIFSIYPKLFLDERSISKLYPMTSKFSDLLLETGYLHIQATKPDTLGVALNDSPLGLAAYILEKFTTGTNAEWKNRLDGGLTEKFSLDKLLDNVMIYWVTGSMTTAMRLYAETFNKEQHNKFYTRIPITIPSACARFKNDLGYQPECILRDRYQQLLHVSDYNGGHFADRKSVV